MSWRLSFQCLAAALLPLLTQASYGDIELPPIISDGAVLQRDKPVPVWGAAPPNSMVKITLGDETKTTQTDATGKWQTQFKSHPAGAKLQLTVRAGEQSKTVKDLIFGDIWLCGGQSNMEWPLEDTDNAAAEIKAANYPNIRQFKVPHLWAAQPQMQIVGGPWRAAKAPYVRDFSAVGYYFAQAIQAQTEVPIGLLESNWGGSTIEAWMSPQALGEKPSANIKRIEKIAADFKKQNRAVTKLLQVWPNALVKEMLPAKADWSQAELATDDWLEIEAPKLWEEQQLPNVDGVVWYRKEFQLSQKEAKQDLNLMLARIDDNDVTWVNGHKVGETQDYAADRIYRVQAKFLKPGTNSIAIRVEDTGGGGGIYDDSNKLAIQWDDGRTRSLSGTWQVKPDRVYLANDGNMNYVPTALYNKMLHPLFRVPIKGAIWYQGESNAGSMERAALYKEQFQTLIKEWRSAWQQPDMPFYWVQLASFHSGNDSDAGSPWAEVREAQTAALNLTNTGQAVIIDVGDRDDIHPRDKKTVGQRLAAIALSNKYDKTTHYRGPRLDSAKLSGSELVAKFTSELANESKHISGFTVVDSKGRSAQITGTMADANTVVFDTSKLGFTPMELRYAWQDHPQHATLKDAQGLPAEPARVKIRAL